MAWEQTELDMVNLAEAVAEFQRVLPGWWWSCGACSVSRHASCGADRLGQDAALLSLPQFGGSFDADLYEAESTLADALRDVMRQALAAKAAA